MASTVTTQGPIKTFESGANLNGKKYHVVKLSSGKVVLADNATDKMIGVLVNDPKNQKDSASVFLINAQGTGKVLAGGSITAGAYLTTNNAGKAVATTTQGNIYFGQALRDADDGDVVEYLPMRGIID